MRACVCVRTSHTILGVEDQEILDQLPRHLRSETLLFLYRGLLRRVAFFQDCEDNFFATLASFLRPQIYSPQDYIITFGDVGEEMFFLAKGTVEVVNMDGARKFTRWLACLRICVPCACVFFTVRAINASCRPCGRYTDLRLLLWRDRPGYYREPYRLRPRRQLLRRALIVEGI